MINGWKSPRKTDTSKERDITAPRYDPSSRISKPKPDRQLQQRPTPPANRGKYLTQDEQSEQFVADEDKFVLKQAKKKADIRVRERRAKPIDRKSVV